MSVSFALHAANLKTVELFNGKNLDGWTPFVADGSNPADVFSADNGIICVKGKPFGYLRTDKKYSDFRLHVEWKYPTETVNSGIFLFVQSPDKIWPNAVECQLMKGRVGYLFCSEVPTSPSSKFPRASSVRNSPSSNATASLTRTLRANGTMPISFALTARLRFS